VTTRADMDPTGDLNRAYVAFGRHVTHGLLCGRAHP